MAVANFSASNAQCGIQDVLSPTLIGFTGLALLGRPGELVPSLHDRAPNKFDQGFPNGGLDGATRGAHNSGGRNFSESLLLGERDRMKFKFL